MTECCDGHLLAVHDPGKQHTLAQSACGIPAPSKRQRPNNALEVDAAYGEVTVGGRGLAQGIGPLKRTPRRGSQTGQRCSRSGASAGHARGSVIESTSTARHAGNVPTAGGRCPFGEQADTAPGACCGPLASMASRPASGKPVQRFAQRGATWRSPVSGAFNQFGRGVGRAFRCHRTEQACAGRNDDGRRGTSAFRLAKYWNRGRGVW